MSEFIRIRVWDVEHGCCAVVQYVTRADYLSITNADQDQRSDMEELSGAEILTTRRDGWIDIGVHPNGMFYTTSEYQ